MLSDIQTYGGFIRDAMEREPVAFADVDLTTRLAIERGFEVVGEALSRLERHDPETAAKISDVRRIIGFRNQIAHGYDTLNPDAIDAIIHESLPNLISEVNELLSSEV